MKKLNELIAELKVPKNHFNSFGNYYYRNCDDILEAVKPLLLKHGLRMKMTDDMVEVGGRVYVRATVVVSDGEVSEEVSANAREAENRKGMDDAQLTGATSSYARKYALNGMFLLDDVRDADSQKPEENKEKPEQIKEVKKPANKEAAQILEQASALLQKLNMPEEKRKNLKQEYKKVTTVEQAKAFLKLAEKEAKASDLVDLTFAEEPQKIGQGLDIF